MPETSPPDNRKVVLAVVAAALLGGWVLIGAFIGYARLPAPFIIGMAVFDCAILYFVWRLIGGPRDGA